jgi:hypothetical protein
MKKKQAKKAFHQIRPDFISIIGTNIRTNNSRPNRPATTDGNSIKNNVVLANGT